MSINNKQAGTAVTNNSSYKISVIGLGYVGLPLAVEFGKKYDVVGFDLSEERINQLEKGFDKTLEVDKAELESVLQNDQKMGSGLKLSNSLAVHKAQ